MSLSATEWPVGWMHCLLTETPLYRDKAWRGKARAVISGVEPALAPHKAQLGLLQEGTPPGRCLFLCYLFSPAVFEALRTSEATSSAFPPLSVDLLLGLVFCSVLVRVFFIK